MSDKAREMRDGSDLRSGPVGRMVGTAEQWLFAGRRATYGLAVVRIIFGLNALAFLAAHWLDRHYLWGDAARWNELIDDNGGFGWPFTMFRGGASQIELDLKLFALAVVLVLFVLGWRTRLIAPIVLILWTSLIESQPVYGDQSDNIFRIVLFYMCFADLSGRWSLDARRRVKQVTGRSYRLIRIPSWLALRARLVRVATVSHNLAVVAMAAQVCIIYVASAMYKIQGELWQDGTAVYYPLHVTVYAPWPELSELVTASSLGVLIATYFSVYIQLFFPLMLLRRATRVIGLLGVSAMHLGIAVLMGLPFFSLFILAVDAIFIRDATYESIQHWIERNRAGRVGRASRLRDGVELRPLLPVGSSESPETGSDVAGEVVGLAGGSSTNGARN